MSVHHHPMMPRMSSGHFSAVSRPSFFWLQSATVYTKISRGTRHVLLPTLEPSAEHCTEVIHMSCQRYLSRRLRTFEVVYGRSDILLYIWRTLRSNNTIVNSLEVAMSSTTKQEPRRIAQIVRLKRSSLQAYKDCHAAVWPEVLKQIKDCNITDYSIFLDERSMTLFASMKWTGTDFEGDMRAMAANPKVREWWQMTDGMQESFLEGSTGSTDPKGWWVGLEEVFRCE